MHSMEVERHALLTLYPQPARLEHPSKDRLIDRLQQSGSGIPGEMECSVDNSRRDFLNVHRVSFASSYRRMKSNLTRRREEREGEKTMIFSPRENLPFFASSRLRVSRLTPRLVGVKEAISREDAKNAKGRKP